MFILLTIAGVLATCIPHPTRTWVSLIVTTHILPEFLYIFDNGKMNITFIRGAYATKT